MDLQNKKVIGILGGMGPDATICLFHRIVSLTEAKKDQDHFPIVIDNNPTIPDRTEALLFSGPSPVPFLRFSAQKLQKAGAEVIGIPCNTAHAFFDEIEKAVQVQLVNMVKLAQKQVLEIQSKKGNSFFLLSTRGTIQSGIFSDLITPDEPIQERIQSLIYSVKAGGKLQEKKEELLALINYFQDKSGGVVLGCTELSLLFWPPYNEKLIGDFDLIVDPLDLLARELIKIASNS